MYYHITNEVRKQFERDDALHQMIYISVWRHKQEMKLASQRVPTLPMRAMTELLKEQLINSHHCL